MEESRFHGLPPLKRFKLLHQETLNPPNHQHDTHHLPAKKRIKPHILPTTTSLPAKKRVWAPQFPPFDNTAHDESEPAKQNPDFDSQLVPKEVQEAESDDVQDGISCSICQSTDGDPTDPIVLCDGCDLMVHTTCYGNPLIGAVPEGDWFCSRCELSRNEAVEIEHSQCCLCPVTGGALKPTTDGRLAHIMCAILVPEVFFKRPEGREGIDCSRVPLKRWEEVCYVCDSARGCSIECSEPKCSLSFHVSCGLKEELCIEYRAGKAGGIVVGFCKIHTQLWKKQQQTGKFKIVPREPNAEKGK